MTIARGRKLKIDGETFVWRLSKAGHRMNGWSGPTANFTAQHGSRGSMLTAKLESKLWTDEHEWNIDVAPEHKISFVPEDARKAIREAMTRGWKPKEKGRTFVLRGVDFTEYRC